MKKIVIPEAYKEGIFLLSQQDSETIEIIFNELEKYTLSEDFNAFIENVIDSLNTRFQLDSKNIIPAVISFYTLRVRHNLTIQETAESLLYGMKNDADAKLKLDEEKQVLFRSVLEKLLSIDKIHLKFLSENSALDFKYFNKIKIVTNLQPISIEQNTGDNCFSINRVLVIEYIDNGELKEIDICFDNEDFTTIKDCIMNEDRIFRDTEVFLKNKNINLIS